MKRLVLVAVLAGCHPATKPRAPESERPLSRAAYGHYLAGQMAVAAADWPGAIGELEAARAAAPDEAMIVVALARADLEGKRGAEALALLAEARKRWPEHPEIWVADGDANAEGHPADAARAYRRAIELAPDDERGYLGLAKVDPAHAEATLHQLVARVPASVDGHYRLAAAALAREDLAGAIIELRAVLEHDPDHIDARLALARALRRTGHLDEAVIQTRSAFDRAAQPLDVAEELFWVLVEADDLQGAVDLLTLLDDDRSDADGLALIARLDRTLGRIGEARAVAEQIARTDPDAGAIALAEATAAGGDRAGAIAQLTPLFGGPRDDDARRLAAELQLASAAPADALATLAPLHAAKPGDAGVNLLVAFALVDQRDLAKAKALFAAPPASRGTIRAATTATAANPTGATGTVSTANPTTAAGADPESQFGLARVLERAGDLPGALAVLEPLLRAHPDAAAPVHNLYGYLLVRAGRAAAARAPLQRARDLAPGDPAVLDSWGLYLLATGATNPAILTLARAVRIAPLEAEITVHLAEAWLADRAPHTAAELLDRAATLAPTPSVTRRIAEIRQAIAAAR